MTRPSCVRCENGNHEACDGGAWDERYKPVVCECFLTYHAAKLKKAARTSYGKAAA